MVALKRLAYILELHMLCLVLLKMVGLLSTQSINKYRTFYFPE